MSSFDFDNDVGLGDIVMWSAHKGDRRTVPALVVSKGNDSLECLAFAYNGSGGTAAKHVSCVRHESDPIWNDASRIGDLISEGEIGCFVLHPDKVLLKQLSEGPRAAVAEQSENGMVFSAQKRKSSKGEKSAPVIDQSFREPDAGSAPELTEEQKKLRSEALKSALAGAGRD